MVPVNCFYSFSFYQEHYDDDKLVDIAQKKELPVVWFKTGATFAVYVEECIFRQTDELSSFLVYMSSFSMFELDWNILRQVRVMNSYFPIKPFSKSIFQYTTCIHLFAHNFHHFEQGNKIIKGGFPNRRALEFIHSTVLTANVDLQVAHMTDPVKKMISKYDGIERKVRRAKHWKKAPETNTGLDYKFSTMQYYLH